MDDLEDVLLQAEKYPNVIGGILDDFFRPATGDARMPLERLAEIAGRLHGARRPLELWLVYYDALLAIDYSKYLKLVDTVSFWSWDSKALAEAESNLAKIIDLTPEKKHYAGCYLYNYGDCREMSDQEMKFQLDLYLRLWRAKKIDGIIACASTIADTGVHAVEIFRQWNETHGDECR